MNWSNRFFKFLLAFFLVFSGCIQKENERIEYPNIVFCMADDWGWPHAGAYGDSAVETPSFDRIANEGILFNHAYVSSPSCTPSRNAVITGKYHWELGPGANLWSTLPEEHQSFIHLLADHGYETGRTKPKTWGPGDISSWIAHHGEHPVGKEYDTFDQFMDSVNTDQNPFFFWLSTFDPHRDYELGSGAKSGIDISKAHLFDHYPKSDTIRSDVADYYYEVQRWDTLVGKMINRLEAENLLNNTIIIMTGDHGMPFPRCKGNLYDAGTRVPFAVYWGGKIQPKRKVDDFISFADIAPTLLESSGIPIPKDMTGKSFLDLLKAEKSGVIDSNRSSVVFGRERHTPAQEKPNMNGYPSRGYRDRDFLYIRNYEPDLWPAGSGNWQNNNFPYQWYSDCDGGPTKNYIIENKDKSEQHRQYFELSFGKRPTEELYDLKNDPGQIVNVASKAEFAETLALMRAKMEEKLISLNDPRVENPNYDGFDGHPYLGQGGGQIPKRLRNK